MLILKIKPEEDTWKLIRLRSVSEMNEYGTFEWENIWFHSWGHMCCLSSASSSKKKKGVGVAGKTATQRWEVVEKPQQQNQPDRGERECSEVMGPTDHNNPNVSVFVSRGAGPAGSLHRQATWARMTEICWEGRVNHIHGSNQQPGVAMSTNQSIPFYFHRSNNASVAAFSLATHAAIHTQADWSREQKGGGQEDSGSGGCYWEEETEVQQGNEPSSLYPSSFLSTHTPHLSLQLSAHAPVLTHTLVLGVCSLFI